ncbi:lytic transglycosylase domain-containing protein [Sphingomonas solaris]|uniref:Lytic transglycosylase domain-containing protein n=2 Tax=Alterirhizorhabdus solaris TaxID=2529389 RepID=A0A558RBZ9_9SPHN|nr:lytic transglycosylase domain-containing protein [Sphingomonas solaris]
MHPAVLSEAPDLSSSSAIPAPTSPPLSNAFRVHDLSRRYVEYRMKGELAAAARSEDSGIADTGGARAVIPIAATSSIAVPGWMRGGYASPPAVSYTPGCAPLAYRPAGFLGHTAEARRAAYYGMMSAIACEHGIPTGLFDAMIIRESGYNPVAISSASAFGLAQLMPATAASLGVDRYDPVQNMRGGARYLRQQLDKFGQVHLALAAYNAGPGRVRAGMMPRIAETQAYVTNILANWTRLGRLGAPQADPFRQTVRVGRQVELAAF